MFTVPVTFKTSAKSEWECRKENKKASECGVETRK